MYFLSQKRIKNGTNNIVTGFRPMTSRRPSVINDAEQNLAAVSPVVMGRF